jgi:hypothetical protein
MNFFDGDNEKDCVASNGWTGTIAKFNYGNERINKY